MAPNVDSTPTQDSGSTTGASPYRIAAPPHEEREIVSAWGFDAELRPVAVVLWIGSVIRVVGALYRHEIVGAEVTLAWMTVSILAWRECARCARSLRGGGGSETLPRE
jgi:hypothetical protein